MDPIDVLATITIVSAVVSKVVERVRTHWAALDGDLVSLVAVIFGGLIAWSLDLQGTAVLAGVAVPVVVDYIVTGIGIGLGAGVVADLTRRSDIRLYEGALEADGQVATVVRHPLG